MNNDLRSQVEEDVRLANRMEAVDVVAPEWSNEKFAAAGRRRRRSDKHHLGDEKEKTVLSSRPFFEERRH